LLVACRLLSSVIAFAVHAIFPFIDIDVTLDLKATTNFLQVKQRGHVLKSTGVVPVAFEVTFYFHLDV
jgi:hypothetical protein